MRTRRAMWSAIVAVGGATVLLAPWGRPAAAEPADKADAGGGDAPLVKRGEYLVSQVARCGTCHTPRNAKGEPDPARNLQGAPIWFKPTMKAEDWEDHAPDITLSGVAGKWNEAKMVSFLMTAATEKGDKAEPPMPAYKLSGDDARAVTAYLRSLPGKKK